MKKKVITMALFLGLCLSWSFSQTLQVDFTTVPITSGAASKYNPKHILAVWVKTSDGTFVSSIEVKAQKRIGYLTNWNSVSNANKVNAVTGATLTSHTSHSTTWNCQKYDGSTIADGDYLLCIELTSGDVTGTYSENPFTISSGTMTFNQVGTNITNLSLVYTSAQTSTVNDISSEDAVSIAPNPVTDQATINFYTNSEAPYTIDIINQAGQIIRTVSGKSLQGDNQYKINTTTKEFQPGIYYCILKTKDYSTSVKMLKE